MRWPRVGRGQRGDHAAASRSDDHEVDGGIPRRHGQVPSPYEAPGAPPKVSTAVDDCYGAEVMSRSRRDGGTAMATEAATVTYPPGGLGCAEGSEPSRATDQGLPAGTGIFSADNHISLADDIFYEGFPEHMKDRAPRVVNVDGGWAIAVDGTPLLVPEFLQVLTQYDPIDGSHTGDVAARLAALDSEGVTHELAFPNSILALFGWPDREVRELCFRIYNEHIAAVQEQSGDRIFGVGLVNWWDAGGTRRTVNELKELGLKTFLMPYQPGRDEEKRPMDYASTAMDGVWKPSRRPRSPSRTTSARARRRRPTSTTRSRSGCCNRSRRSATCSPSTSSVASSIATRGCSRLVRGRDQLGPVGHPGRATHRGVVRAPHQPRGPTRPPALLGQPHVCLVHGRSARPWS